MVRDCFILFPFSCFIYREHGCKGREWRRGEYRIAWGNEGQVSERIEKEGGRD